MWVLFSMVRELEKRLPEQNTTKTQVVAESKIEQNPTSITTKGPLPHQKPELTTKKPFLNEVINVIGEFSNEFALPEFDPESREIITGAKEEKLSKRQRIKNRFNKIKEKRLSIAEKIKKPAIALAATIFVWRVEQKAVKPIKPEYAKGFDKAFMELAKDPSVLFILVSNHTGHADAAGTAVIAKHLTDLANKVRPVENQFRGFMLTIAASLEAAHQNLFLQQCARRAKKILPKKFHMPLGEFTRKKDVDQYEMDSNGNREYAEKTSAIIKGKDDRVADGLAYYIEGTVEGGRRAKEGENAGQRNGTQRIDWDQYDKIINKAQSRHHRKVAIITASSKGACEILDPDRDNQPTKKAILYVANPLPSRKSLLTVKVDLPIPYDDMVSQLEGKMGQKIIPQDTGDEIGRKISKPLPPNERGYYKDSNK